MGSELGITAGQKAKLDTGPVAIWWIVWGIAWTIPIAAGMVFLILRRHSPVLRNRSLALSLTAIVFLHIYWWSLQFAVFAGAVMPGDGQFWIMGLYLPCGLALFHGSNSYFLHVAKQQRRYAKYDFLIDAAPENKRSQKGVLNKFLRLDYTVRVVIMVAVAMFIQVPPPYTPSLDKN